MSDNFTIGDTEILRGESKKLELFIAKLYDYTDLSIPVKVVRGKEKGPTLFLSAAIHGDEISGVEIIKRVLGDPALKEIRGTLITVPIVNVFGFNTRSRYLPDRKDLNRCFPGAKNGSLGSQMAHLFVNEIVTKCDFGIDFHSGSFHRSNLPQIRINGDDKKALELGCAFGAPVLLSSPIRDGSLRQAATDKGVPVLLFEGGEALRNSEFAIRLGHRGALSVMQSVGMLPESSIKHAPKRCFLAKSSHWLRAPHSGTLTPHKRLGATVKEGEVIGTISDPFGEDALPIKAKIAGVIIGRSSLPLVNRGDALFHVATLEQKVLEDEFENQLDDLDYELMS